jgi:condensation domain-containing protein
MLTCLSSRHVALRTRILLGPDGEPRQHAGIPEPGDIHLTGSAEPGIEERLLDELDELTLDLSREVPFRTLAIGDEHAVTRLVLQISHCVIDGHGAVLLKRELQAVFRHVTEGADLPPPPDRQPIDTAEDERDGRLARVRLSSEAYWRTAVRDLPNRMFLPIRPDILEHHGAKYSSDRLGLLMALVANRQRTTPAAVYSAAVQAILGSMSDAPRSLVRMHFSGRTPQEADIVGCYHHILPVPVDISDRPSLTTLVKRVSTEILRMQIRSRIGYLTLLGILTAEERRRGTPFAEGTTVNLTFDPSYLSARQEEEALLSRLADTVGETELLMDRKETVADVRGFDAYLSTHVTESGSTTIASFNRAVFAPDQMRGLLLGPERLLTAMLEGDVPWDAVPDITGLDARNRRAGREARRRGRDIVHPVDVDRVLLTHPGVHRTQTAVELDEHGTKRLYCTVTTEGASSLSPATLREYVLQHATRANGLAAPDDFRVLPDLQRRDSSGVRPSGELLDALLTAVAEVCATPRPDPDLSYVEAGASLSTVPAVLARLADLGYTGLGPHEFTLPLSLRSLALRGRKA